MRQFFIPGNTNDWRRIAGGAATGGTSDGQAFAGAVF